MIWHPIETALPTRLLLFGNTRHDVGIVFTGWKARNGRIYADNGDSVKATHWTFLPKPPEQNKGDELEDEGFQDASGKEYDWEAEEQAMRDE